jgi:3-phosphoinositide dependent protein kinase-1
MHFISMMTLSFLKVQQIFREKEILGFLSTKENRHPFIVQLYCTFQDNDSLYFVMSYASEKDLLTYLRTAKQLSLEQAQFAAAEVVSALGHMHQLNVVHRDIKPENILLSSTWHVLLTDFGCAKRLETAEEKEEEPKEGPRKRKCSFVGTPYYVSPEILNGKEVQQACDYWSLGVVVFQCLSGERPFSEISEYLTYQKILKAKYTFPDNFPENAKSFVEALLVVNPEERFGSVQSGGVDAVKQHTFFQAIKWDTLPDISSPLAVIK